MAEPYYITTAINYPNGKPHIGHAYEAVAADVSARYQRLMGRDVRFQTGTDEHGLKMAQKARELGMSPRQLADEMSGHFRVLADRLNISYDRFIRTVEDEHHRASRALWQAMEASGDLYQDRYEGWYSVRDEAYSDESELVEGEEIISFILVCYFPCVIHITVSQARYALLLPTIAQ
jgi:methionyl-tRNA synthetase